MPLPFQRRLWVSLLSAGAALAAWKALPTAESVLFKTVLRVQQPQLLTGEGTHQQPWTILSPPLIPKTGPNETPVIVSIGDDTEHFFQSSPPLPIDVAVILNNFHRRGVKRLGSAAVFSWENPDPISLVALEKTMAGFESLITATPLSRGATPQPMPASFRRASIPLGSVQGSYLQLPVVNRVPIPNVILAGDNGWSGFSALDAEENTGPQHLLARWEDRVVFSFPVLAFLQSHGLPVEGIRIKVGEYLALSATGPFLPIDSYGRLLSPLKSNAAEKVVPASAMISDTDALVPAGSTAPVILRDDQSAADAQTRGFSRNLPGFVEAVSTASVAISYPRLGAGWEVTVLVLTTLLIGFISGLNRSKTCLLFLMVAGILAQWLTARATFHWLPLTPFLAATGSATLLCAILPCRRFAGKEVATPLPSVIPESTKPAELLEPLDEPKPVEATKPVETPKLKEKKSPPPKKAAKKVTTKTASEKKTVAKKTASKKSRGTKQPPASDS